jgi:predicted dehydrogenase
MQSIKVGIIGAGAISEHHCVGVNGHPRASVVAVADTHAGRREAFAKQHNVPRAYASADQLIADPDLDAVTIAVPNVFHAPLAIAALQAGKHVMLEKPFAPTLHDALDIAHVARASRKVFMVGMNQRFNRESQLVKSAIARGELGDIYHGKTAWMRRSGIPKLGTWFCRKDMAGGGTLLDIGVHMLDLCLYLIGNFHPEAVSGAAYGKFGHLGVGEGDWGKSDRGEMRFDVEDFATALIKLKGGATVALDVSWAMNQEPLMRHEVHLFGAEGGASVYPTARIFKRHHDHSGSAFSTTEPGVDGPLAYPACCRFSHWIDTILGDAEPLCTIEQSLAVQQIIDAIYESARTGKEVRLDSRVASTQAVSSRVDRAGHGSNGKAHSAIAATQSLQVAAT